MHVPAFRRAAAAFAVASILASPIAAYADDATAQVQVDVEDATTHRALGANVALIGPTTLTDFADATGTIVFKDVYPGVYVARVSRSGYATIKSARFEAGGRTKIKVILTKEPRKIGSVTVINAALPDGMTLDAKNPLRRLSASLVDALGATAGVSVDQGDGPGRDLSVSLEGRPASQTGIEIEGIPLNGPGTVANLRALSPDLFTSAAIKFSGSAASPAGSVSFRTLEPTLRWRSTFSSTIGIDARTAETFGVQGTAGGIGLAVLHAARRTPSAAGGAFYEDASGIAYDHFGADATAGTSVKARAQVGAQNLMLLGMASRSTSDALCARNTNLLPCGWGPGNDIASTASVLALTDTFTVGAAALSISTYAVHGGSDVDFRNRYVNGIAVPAVQSGASSTLGSTLTLQFASGATHSPALALTDSRTELEGSAIAPAGVSSFAVRSSYRSATVSDSFRVGRAMKISPHVGYATSSSSPGGSLLSGVTVSAAGRAGTMTFTLDRGSAPTPDGRASSLTTPDALLINCAAGNAQGTIPGDPSSSAETTSARVGASWRAGRARLSAQAYVSTTHAAGYTAIIPATAIAGGLPAGYLGGAQAVFAAPLNCGAGAALGAGNLYFQTVVRDVDLLYRGARLSVSAPLRKNVEAFANLDLRSARAYSDDPRLRLPTAPFASGAQIHGVAPMRATFGAVAGPANGMQVLASARWSGTNNVQNLPANWIVDAGLSLPVRRGAVDVLVTNAFASHAGFFQSAADALPVALADGSSRPGISRPNAPRNVQVTYTVAFGRNAAPPEERLAPNAAPSAAPQSLYAFEPFPEHAPADAFKRNSGTVCTRDRGALTERVDDVLRAALAGRTAPPPPDARVELIDASSQSYQIVTPRIDVAKALMSCVVLRIGSEADATRAGVYVPKEISLVEQQFYFSPRVGYYILQLRPAQGFLQRFRTMPVPASPPARPFAFVDSERCVEPLRSVASDVLVQLERYFAGNTGERSDWLIVRKDDGPAPLFELSSNRTGTLLALFSCAHVASAPESELRARGIRGTYTSLMYSPQLGLFIMGGKTPQ